MCNLERVVLSMDTTLMLSHITLGFILRSSLRTLGSFMLWGHKLETSAQGQCCSDCFSPVE